MKEFDSTAWAYDECNCSDDMADGEVFVVPSEKVIGVAWAWPVAATEAYGALHTLGDDVTPDRFRSPEECEKTCGSRYCSDHLPLAILEGYRKAREEAIARGWPVRKEL